VLDGHSGVVTSNGVFRPIALVHGEAVATWAMSGGQAALQPLGPLYGTVSKTLARDAAAVHRVLGAAHLAVGAAAHRTITSPHSSRSGR